MVKATWLKQALRKFVVRPLSMGLFVFIVLCASVLFLVLFSANDTMYEALVYNNQERYSNTDIVIELGNNYEQRFFWLQPINAMNSRFDYLVPILKYPAQTVDGKNVVIHFSQIDEYRKIASLPDEPISYQEVYFIGDYFSENRFIQIPVEGETIDLEIKGIVSPSQINLDTKQPIIVADINLSKKILGINIDNLYNEVYIKLKSGVDKETAISDIQALFPRQVVRDTENLEVINQTAQHFSVSIRLIASLTIIPLTLVMLLLSRVNFKKNEQEMLILRLLGSTTVQSFVFFFLEYLVSLLIGFVLAVPLWIGISKLMVGFLSNAYIFLMANPLRHLVFSFLVLFLYLLGLFLLSFLRLLKVSYQTARKNLSLKYEKKLSTKQFFILLVVSAVLGIVWLLLKVIIFPQMSITLNNHLLKGVMGLLIGISLCAIILKILSVTVYRLLPQYKRFTVIEGRDLAFHKLKYWFMVMTLFAIITISYAFFTSGALNSRAQNVGNSFGYNITLNNITINHNQYDELLKSFPEVKWYEKGFTYFKVSIPEHDLTIPMVLSVEATNLNRFLGFEIAEETLDLMKDQTSLAIMLSQKYQTVYGLKIGDLIALQLNQNLHPSEYVVAGFIPEEMDIYAITNLYLNQHAVSTHAFNSLFLKGFDPNYLVRALSMKLSKEGVSVALKSTIFSSLTEWVSNNQKFIKLFILIVSSCLLLMLISIYGFIYLDKKSYYSLLNVLGDVPSYWEVVKKGFLVNLLIWIMSWVALGIMDDSILALTRYAKTEFGIQGIADNLWQVYLAVSLIIFALDSWEHLMKRTNRKLVGGI